MSTQIAVRLPDDLLRFVDEQVADGKAASRAEAVKDALKLSRKRIAAERELEILRSTENNADLQELAEWSVKQDRSRLD